MVATTHDTYTKISCTHSVKIPTLQSNYWERFSGLQTVKLGMLVFEMRPSDEYSFRSVADNRSQ